MFDVSLTSILYGKTILEICVRPRFTTIIVHTKFNNRVYTKSLESLKRFTIVIELLAKVSIINFIKDNGYI